jgi:hypothetical protein
VERRQAARPAGRAPHPLMRIIGTMRLSAFCLPFFFVIAGLDPAIHADEKLDRICR